MWRWTLKLMVREDDAVVVCRGVTVVHGGMECGVASVDHGACVVAAPVDLAATQEVVGLEQRRQHGIMNRQLPQLLPQLRSNHQQVPLTTQPHRTSLVTTQQPMPRPVRWPVVSVNLQQR